MRFVQRLRRVFGEHGRRAKRDDLLTRTSDHPQNSDRFSDGPDSWIDETSDIDALIRENEAELRVLEQQVVCWSALVRGGPVRDRAPVDILLCPACGVYGEHLLDADGFPSECRTCGWEGGAV